MLVYTSKSKVPVDKALLDDILKVARELNSRDQLTGFLVVRDGYFLQLLEGNEEMVRKCYARIQKDKRHKEFVVHGEAFTDSRIMPSWNMALVESNTQGASSELIELFKLGHQGTQYHDPTSLEAITRIFARAAKIL